jgi:tRNA threonylcarbamoyladenosine biosynthesis protein TsaE
MAFELITHSPEETQELGSKLGKLAQTGDIYLLAGNLGTGKTTLTQGIAWGLGVAEYAFSPSYVLIREYHGRLPLYHMDLYRLENIEEIVDMALDDYLDGQGICVIEWADKGLAVLPHNHLLIKMNYISLADRGITIEAEGERYQQLLTYMAKY